MSRVVVNGVRLNFSRLGPGPGCGAPTVVFLHGLVMDNLSSFFYTVAGPVALAADVVLYDLRGHGRSQRPATGYAPDDAVADLVALLGALGIDHPVYLCGNSYGGLVAIEAALAHRAQVAGLILVEAHLVTPGWGEQMADTIDLGLWALHEDAHRERLSTARDRRWQCQQRDTIELAGQTTLVPDLRRARLSDLEALPGLDCPTLALYGQRSDSLAVAELLASSLPRCQLRLFPDASHSLLMERPEEVAGAVTAWLAQVEGAGRARARGGGEGAGGARGEGAGGAGPGRLDTRASREPAPSPAS